MYGNTYSNKLFTYVTLIVYCCARGGLWISQRETNRLLSGPPELVAYYRNSTSSTVSGPRGEITQSKLY